MSLITLLPFVIIIGGVFVLVRLRAFFILHPIRTCKAILSSLDSREARSSLTLALAGTLGIGNIVGVAVGIIIGGPGSVFWLVFSALFASALKYAESSLAADMHTDSSDGMMSVLLTSFSRRGGFLSSTYAVGCLLLSLIMGAALQSSGVISSGAHFSIPPLTVGLFFALAVLAVIIFGAERVGTFTAMIIPATTVLYIFLAIVTIFSDPSRIPSAVRSIFCSAFSSRSASGGAVGFLTGAAVREGFSRGLLSNEAGAGTSSLAHSRISGDPASAGLLGMCEVFFDTVLLCPLTALAILVAVPDPHSYTSGMALVLSSIGAPLGSISACLVVVCMTAFAFSTVICWYCYGSRCLSFLGIRGGIPYMLVYLTSTLAGIFLSDRMLIAITDHVLLLLTTLTVLAIMKNSDRLVRLSENSGLLGYPK